MSDKANRDGLLDAFAHKGGASETRYISASEREFYVEARRDRMLAAWLADLMKLDGATRDAYVAEVIAADLAKPGDGDVVAKVLADLADRGMPLTEAQLREKLGEFEAQARAGLAEP